MIGRYINPKPTVYHILLPNPHNIPPLTSASTLYRNHISHHVNFHTIQTLFMDAVDS